MRPHRSVRRRLEPAPNGAAGAARTAARCLAVIGAVCLTACADEAGTTPTRGAMSATNVAAAPNPLNALSLLVSFDATEVDSARVVYERVDGLASATPFVHVTSARPRIAVVGLDAETAYRARIEAHGAGGQATTDAVDAVTGTLPTGLRGVRLSGAGRSTGGYTLVVPIAAPTDTVAYVIAFDSTDRLAWYRAFANAGWTIEAKQQPNGHVTVYLGRSYGWQPTDGQFVELEPGGDIVHTFMARTVPYTDPHELRFTMRGNAVAEVHLLGYRMERTDLSALGGPADTALAVHVLERQDADGQPVLVWDAGASYSPADWPRSIGFPSDLVHPSAFTIDRDGDYVVSLQAIDEVVNVDARTGRARWRLGGARSDFRIVDDPLTGFRGQHGVQVLENGNLLFLDNRRGAVPSSARAVEYSLDVGAMTARLVWEFRPSPAVASPIMGSVQRLANGNTVIGLAIPGRVMEVDRGGRVVADATLTTNGIPTQFYRAIRIASLYTYSAP
jgi:hypothetical protein